MQGDDKRAVVTGLAPACFAVKAGACAADEGAQHAVDHDEVDAGILVGFRPVVGPLVTLAVGQREGGEGVGAAGASEQAGDDGGVFGVVEIAEDEEGSGGFVLQDALDATAQDE